MLMSVFICGFAQQHITFDRGKIGPEWQFVGQKDNTKYCLVDGKLRLIGSVTELFEEGESATYMGLPVPDSLFQADTRLTLLDTENGNEGGLCVYQSPRGYVQCCLNNYQGLRRLKVRLQLLSHRLLLVDKPVGMLREVWLRVRGDARKLKFYYSVDGETYQWLEDVERRLLQPDIVGGDGSLLAGLFAFNGNTKYAMGYVYADFDFFNLDHTELSK